MENLDTETILKAGAAAVAVQKVDGVPYVVAPEGYRLHNIADQVAAALEREAPKRQTGVRTLLDADSFIRAVKPYVDAGHDVGLFYHVEPSPRFTAILNAAKPGTTSHEDHRAVYDAPLSREWKTWTKASGLPMGQQQFALFIETNLLDIVMPTGAEMLELATNFQAKKNVNFASGIRLQNGQHQLTYEEKIESKAGERGQLSIPDEIRLLLPVFEGSTIGFEITAKFRYSIKDGDLAMAYELVRPHKVLELATADLLKQIQEGTTLAAFKATV